MTNKEKYIKCFSGVEPSDEIKERILNMSSTKKKCSFKALAIAFAVLIMAAAMFTANAATDGAIGEKIGEVSKEITEKISIMFNGEEIEVTVKQTVVTDENGNSNIFEVILPENPPENKQGDDEVVFELNEVMDKYCRIILQMSKESTGQVEIDVETESDNDKVILETE